MKLLSGNKYKTIGAMSGTSLDGLDLAAVEFQQTHGKWEFSIAAAETIPYDRGWSKKLQTSPALSGEELIELHNGYGRFIGLQVNQFIEKTEFTPDLIASHGHTVFHRPEKQFTFQLGNGAVIATVTNIATVADFRTGDVALGGQGAPLVPIGDELLFPDFDYCLNLGGFANISYQQNRQRVAYDVCPVNFVLNHFAEKRGLPFDKNGELGRSGKINGALLEKLNSLSFYEQSPPKSLGREWVESEFFPMLDSLSISDSDKLRSAYEHIAIQIGKVAGQPGKMLLTGGGTFNTFLVERIEQYAQPEIVIPAPEIINFKEALIFAFLGVLKIRGEINCLSSVTGAERDSCCGVVF